MKKIINRKNAAAVACAAMMICAAGAVPDNVLSVSMPVQAAEAAEQTSLPQVTGLTSKTPDISSIRLSWNAVSGADGYSVGMRSKGQYPEIADVTDTTYLVTGLPAATRENFKVRAYKIVNGQKVYGDYSVNYNSATNPRPISGLKAQTGNASVSLSWKKVGCSNYRVFMLKNGKWKQIAQTDTNSYTVKGLDAGSYTFKVRACKRDDKGANHYGKYSQEITAQAVMVDKVTGLTSKTPNTSSIKLIWNAVNGADGYSVGMRSKGKYPEIADVKGTTYTVKGLPAATRENFKVRAYKIVDGVKIYSDYCENYNSATNPRKVTGVKASDITASTLDLNWKSVGCTSYKVFIYTNGKWKNIASSTVNSCAINGLYAKTTYRFKVRACKTDDKGSNHYGAYSEEITVKTPDHTVEVINGMSYVDGVLLANKTYSLPASYDPKGLTKETSAAFKKMQTAAYKDGISLWVCSGYRSYYDQKYLYDMYCNRDGKAAADKYSARPGYSDHQTGMAIDVNNASDSFGGTREAKWLANNCAKYGFIIRYPKGKEAYTGYQYESWHIRYVGTPLAQNITNSGLSLEEYFGITSQYKD